MADNRADSGIGETGNKVRAKAPSPWSVRGVSREARAKAGKAAARRRETIGEWVTNALTQAANEELGTGPRRDQSQYTNGGLPASTAQDDTPLGKALLALAERFERSEARNEAIMSLAERMEGSEYKGGEVSVMAEQIGLVEQRSRALTLLVERLESAEKRENSLLTLMHGVAERAERGEERINAVTRGLADLALSLETALTRNNVRTAQSIGNSVAPLEDAVNALGNRLSSGLHRAASEAPSAAAAQFYSTPAGSSAGGGAGGARFYGAAPQAQSPEQGGVGSESSAQGGAEKSERLKFDFNALNAHAIKNSQRLAQDLDESGEDGKAAEGGGFGQQAKAETDDPSVAKASAKTNAKANDSADWAREYMVEDGAQNSSQDIIVDGPQEPTLDHASPTAAGAPSPPDTAAAPVAAAAAAAEEKPAVSEEDEMLLALKQAIKPKNP